MNIKVTLVPANATETERKIASRVIDGSLLKSETPGGRSNEAIAIYKQMMGIKATPHQCDAVETEEAPYNPPVVQESEVAKYMQRQESQANSQIASIVAATVSATLASLGFGPTAAPAAPVQVAAPAATVPETEVKTTDAKPTEVTTESKQEAPATEVKTEVKSETPAKTATDTMKSKTK
jgi:hypothetical protein